MTKDEWGIRRPRLGRQRDVRPAAATVRPSLGHEGIVGSLRGEAFTHTQRESKRARKRDLQGRLEVGDKISLALQSIPLGKRVYGEHFGECSTSRTRL